MTISVAQMNLMRTMAHDHCREMAASDLTRIANMMREYADKLDRTAATITAAEMGYAINEIENLQRNLNFAILARRTAELAVAESLIERTTP